MIVSVKIHNLNGEQPVNLHSDETGIAPGLIYYRNK